MLNKDGFDKWSNEYDACVKESYIKKEYPFDGYFDTLDIIYREIKPGSKVLDVGCGTGVLTKKIYDLNCAVYGIDFSEKMLRIARERTPDARLYKCDFNDGLPAEITKEKFDYIISTYALHHLEDAAKAKFISKLAGILNDGGKIIIGDVCFTNESEMEKCKIKAGDNFDNDEIYIVADKIVPLLEEKGLSVKYRKVSHCAGILYIEKTPDFRTLKL